MSKLALVLAMWCACSSSPKPPPGGGGGDTGSATPTDNHAACTTSDDCVVVETGCCDHCNGGKAEAYNKAHADAHKPQQCADTTCTERGCGDAVASCEAGTCKISIAPL